jgi:hypothetical protein
MHRVLRGGCTIFQDFFRIFFAGLAPSHSVAILSKTFALLVSNHGTLP